MRDPRFDMEAESMRMNAEARRRGKHGGHGRDRLSIRSVLIKLVMMIGLVAALFWWVYI